MNWLDTDATSANPGRWTVYDPRTGKNYKFETLLGRGAYGEVYAATVTNDSGLRRDYALKVLSRDSLQVRRGLAKAEAVLMSKLQHENVVRSFGYFFKLGHLYITMERCMNVTLCRVVRMRGVLSIAETRLYSYQLCCGLKYLRGLRVVHHDIKASNLLFGLDGKLKISDFGLSVKLGPKETIRVWTGSFAEYFAPEILASKEPYSFGVDVWSLGCVVYYMLVGFYPFSPTSLNLSEKERLARILSCSYEVPEDVQQESPSIVDLLAMTLVRADRRASIYELMQHEFFAELDIPVVVPSIDSAELSDRQPSLAASLITVDAWLNIRRLPLLLSDLLTYGPVLNRWEISEMTDAEFFPCVPVVEVISLTRTWPWDAHWLKGYFFVLNNGTKGCAFDDGTAITLYLDGTHFQFTESQLWTTTAFSVADPPSFLKTKLGMVLRKFSKYKKNVQHQSGSGNVTPLHQIHAVMKVHVGFDYLCTLLTNGQVHLLYPETRQSVIFCPTSEAVTCKERGLRTTYDLDTLCDVGIGENLREKVEVAASLVGSAEEHPYQA